MNKEKIENTNINQPEIKQKDNYQSPEISKISANQINKDTNCSCEDHDDNPYS